MSRSYGQLCGLALALDVIGDRWSLLIVRELLVRDGARYTDLRDGLPGIATNLLADRLRDLEAAGVLTRHEPRPPVATPVFRLTERGRALRPAVEALALWGGEQVPAARADIDFRSRWLVIPLEAMLTDTAPEEPPVTLSLLTGDEPVVVHVGSGKVTARQETPLEEDPAGLTVSGPPKPVLGLIAGKLPAAAAEKMGVQLRGDRSVLTRVGLT